MPEPDVNNGGNPTPNPNPNPPAPVVTPTPAPAPNPAPEKTFNQRELDDIVVSRVAKERSKILKKLGVEDESKIDELLAKITKSDEISTEYAKLKHEKEVADLHNELRKLNVDDEFLDYVASKVTGTGPEFITNAKAFLDKNPKMLKENYSQVNSSLNLNGQSTPDLNKMTTEQYLEWRKTHKL